MSNTVSGSGRQRSPRLAFIGGFGNGNIGNEISFEVVSTAARQIDPNVEITIVTPFPEGAEQRFGLPALGFQQGVNMSRGTRPALRRVFVAARHEAKSLTSAWALLGRVDALVVPGTGILDDFGERPWGMPLALAGWAVLARMRRCHLELLAIGAGPVAQPVSRWLLMLIGSLASKRSYRDQWSKDYMMKRHAARSTDVVTHDVAFGHDSTPPTRPRTGAGLRVGIGVMAYGGWRGEISGDRFNRYINALAQVVDHVVGRGDTVVLLKGQPVDDAAIEALLGELSATTRAGIECPSMSTYDELLSAVGTTDVVLATRYHNLVAALASERPVVSLGYAPKNAALLARLHLQDQDQSISTADPSWVTKRIDEIRRGEGLTDEALAQLRSWRGEVSAHVRQRMTHLMARQPTPTRRSALG